MAYTTNIKGSTLLLSKFLFYMAIPISLMGAMMPGGGPPNDAYVQAYDTCEADYNATNLNTNQLLNNYSNQLLLAMNSIRGGAQHARLWAQHQQALAQINFRIATIIRERISIMLGHFAEHATNAQGRAAAVLANAPGQQALTVNEQNRLNALNQAKVIDQNAQMNLNLCQNAVDEAQNLIGDINNRFNNIQQRINQMNQPILGMNYNVNDVLTYNQALTAIKNDSNHINDRAFAVKDRSLISHNQLNIIRQFMIDIVQLNQLNNLQIPLPPY